MSLATYIADLHCHSGLQPFGQSFSRRPGKKDDLWYYNPPRLWKKWLKVLLGLSAYSQANFTAAVKGNVRLMSISLYPPEILLFKNRLGENLVGDSIENLITRYGRARVNYLQSEAYNYFTDLEQQYQFVVAQNGHVHHIGGNPYRFLLVRNYEEARAAWQSEVPTVAVTLNVEGGHSFGLGYPPFDPLTPETEEQIIAHFLRVKNWEYAPLYLTPGHHFYNQLCGHCQSLPAFVDFLAGQETGMNTGFTAFGERFIETLLDSTAGRRILSDVKHMSPVSRQHYYALAGDSPLIYSHGGANGYADYSQIRGIHKEALLNEHDIGLFDNEIVRIAQSQGLMGMNVDQRVMSGPSLLEQVKKAARNAGNPDDLDYWSEIIWANISHIAVVLDRAGLPAWDFTCIGSDFDGAINPIRGCLSLEDMPALCEAFLRKASAFVSDNSSPLSADNRLEPEAIVQKIMWENQVEFLRKHF